MGIYKDLEWLKSHFPKGSYVYTSWDNGRRRGISRVKEFIIDELHNQGNTSLICYYGVNSINKLCIGHTFGVGYNEIRFATEKEIEFLNKKLMKSGIRNGGLRFLH